LSTYYEQPKVHPQEYLFTEFYGICSCIRIHSLGRCQDVCVSNTSWHRTDCLYECKTKHHKTACASVPEDEQMVVRNVSKTIQLNEIINVKSVHFVGPYYICTSKCTVQKT